MSDNPDSGFPLIALLVVVGLISYNCTGLSKKEKTQVREIAANVADTAVSDRAGLLEERIEALETKLGQ